MKENVVDFFRLDRRKIKFALILPVIHVVVALFLSTVTMVLWPAPEGAHYVMPTLNPEGFLFYPLWVLLWYPFSCSAITFKEKGLDGLKKDKFTFGLVIFGAVANPFVLSPLLMLGYFLFLAAS